MDVVVCRRDYTGAEGDVTLDVVVGEGHRGDILVLVGFEEKGHGTDEIHALNLGPASSLAGKTISVRVRVAPVNPQSTRSSVRCTLHSDGADLEHDCQGPKPEDGTPIPFAVDFDVA